MERKKTLISCIVSVSVLIIILLIYFLILSEYNFFENLNTFSLTYIPVLAALITVILVIFALQQVFKEKEKEVDLITNSMLLYSSNGIDNKFVKKSLLKRFGKVDILGADVFMMLINEFYDEIMQFLSMQGEIRLVIFNMDSTNPSDFYSDNTPVEEQRRVLLKTITDIRQNHRTKFVVYECYSSICLKGFAINTNLFYKAGISFFSSVGKKTWLYVNLKNAEEDTNRWKKEINYYIDKARLIE